MLCHFEIFQHARCDFRFHPIPKMDPPTAASRPVSLKIRIPWSSMQRSSLKRPCGPQRSMTSVFFSQKAIWRDPEISGAIQDRDFDEVWGNTMQNQPAGCYKSCFSISFWGLDQHEEYSSSTVKEFEGLGSNPNYILGICQIPIYCFENFKGPHLKRRHS